MIRFIFRSANLLLVTLALGTPLLAWAHKTQSEAKPIHLPEAPMPGGFYNADAKELAQNFMSPPDAVKPWVYWYWVNDHITKSGIENDLAAMQKAGIGTALIGIIHLNPSNGKYGKTRALSDVWWEHLYFAIEKAADYDIDLGIFNSPGWSQSGGPWITPEQSMRYLDSNEYQFSDINNKPLELTIPEGFHQTVSLIAFKTPESELMSHKVKGVQATAATLSSEEKSIPADVSVLVDDDLSSSWSFPQHRLDKDSRLQIEISYRNRQEMRSLLIYPEHAFSAEVDLQYMNNNGGFETLSTFSMQRPPTRPELGPEHDAPIAVSFPEVESTDFRILISNIKRGRGPAHLSPGLKEIKLSGQYTLERFVEKKLAKVHPTPQPKHDSYVWEKPVPSQNAELAIEADDVIDLTKFFDGKRLNWEAPEGNWTIVHYFMRPTGATNGPSSNSARGPEVDKLNKQLAQYHFDAYVGKILSALQSEKRTALKYVVVDSYEKGAQNWTDDFKQQFKHQYGYDPTPFLPVYTGRIVNSADQSERFLWDVRRLVADKVAHAYAAGLRERAHEHGLKLWLENYGHWGFPGEFLQYGGQADIVSGEFWASGNLGAIELKAASSAAHIYGHRTVMSESFTSGRSESFKNHPWSFKKRGDWSFVEGINHTLLHVYIQQAYEDKKPGVNAWFGSEFNRNNTWFSYMGSWLDYVKRSNYMLQQGQYVADILYFIGEDAPKMTGAVEPEVPSGYSYDFINAEIILNKLSVKNGQFELPNGSVYKLLVLPDVSTIRPELLKKISELVKAGGSIYGPKPSSSPSLENFPHADNEVQHYSNLLWQDINGADITHRHYGLGNVLYQNSQQTELKDILAKIGSPPDVGNLPETVIWSHRRSDTHDIYFVANQSDEPQEISPSFRLHNPDVIPQLWDPITGEIVQIARFTKDDRKITVPLFLQGLGSAFIVFEKEKSTERQSNFHNKNISFIQRKTPFNEGNSVPASVWVDSTIDADGALVITSPTNGEYEVTLSDGSIENVSINSVPSDVKVKGPWNVSFEEERDVDTSLVLERLTSLTELSPTALQHYSGEVIYQTTITMNSEQLHEDLRWFIDLGEVGVVARLFVNGQSFGELWSRPLTADVTNALRVGQNEIKIEVATTWLNRLVGDLTFPEALPDSIKPKAFNTQITFETRLTETTELQRSGLIGPVLLKPIKRVKL